MAIPAYYSLLQRGSSGPDVALVQTWLNGVRDACTWYSELKTDGKFGISTENAVKEFQLKNKMNVDGKVGANTWNVLYTRYTAKHGLHVPYPGIALRSGSSGGTVRLVQQKLNSLGERLTADGRFGAATALPPTARSAKKRGRRCSDLRKANFFSHGLRRASSLKEGVSGKTGSFSALPKAPSPRGLASRSDDWGSFPCPHPRPAV